MARYPGTLESANTNEFGIVFADHIQGHKTVANLNALYNISDAILSKSKTNAGNDAIGQEWYVVSEGYYYRLDNWANRRQASGWRKLQNTDEEFDSLQNHGADKIKSFTTTNSTVSLNFNTWKNSTTSTDGSVTIPAATGDQAGVLTANGKDQLTQLNKIGEVTHLTDGGVFTEEASTVTVHYSCINTKEGATSAVVTKSEAIPEATLTNAGVLSAAKRNQLEQLDKIGEVTHLTDGGVFTTNANTATIHYKCIDTNSGANSAVSTKTANIPAATLTNAGVLDAAHRNQLEQLDKIGEVTHLTDNGVFTTDANTVTMHYQCVDTDAGANSAVSTKTAVIPEATLTNAGTLASSNRNQLEQLNKIEKTSFLHHTSDNRSATFTSTGSAVTLHWDTIDTTDGANSEVTERSANIPAASSTSAGTMSSTDKIEHDRISTVNFALGAVTPNTTAVTIAASKTNITNGSSVANNITIPGVTETAAGVMSSADKAKLNDITIPEGGVNFSGKETDIINGAGDSVDLMAKFPATVITNLTGVTPSTSSATINFSKSAKDTLDYNAATSNTITIPAATTSAAGLMSSTDKTEHDRISTVNFELGAVTPSSTTVQIAANKTNITDGSDVTNNITLSAVTSSAAGVMTAADKVKLDTTIPNYTVNTHKISSNPVLNSGDIKMDDYVEATGTSEAELSIKTTDTVGIAMGKLQKQQLDNEEVVATALAKLNTSCGFDTNGNYSPSGPSTSSSTSLADAILDLDNTLNSNKSTIDNYTVNGLKISTNPVLDGADVKITGYSQPSSSSALTSSDTINAALGKLEKGLNNEISNRTTAVNNLRSEINNNINTKLDELEQQINENIDTRLTEVENEINNTITPKINSINTTISNLDIFSDFKTDSGTASATTNNDSITIAGGTNISTSGSGKTVTINLDSTISLTRVNASSGFYQQSDERLRSNIKPLEHTLEDICSIPTDSFILNGKQDLGTIAQDVEKIIPEVVCECEVKAAEIPNPENFTKVEKDGETYVLVKEVDYAKLSILALEGIKLLKAEVDKLKEELALRENK